MMIIGLCLALLTAVAISLSGTSGAETAPTAAIGDAACGVNSATVLAEQVCQGYVVPTSPSETSPQSTCSEFDFTCSSDPSCANGDCPLPFPTTAAENPGNSCEYYPVTSATTNGRDLDFLLTCQIGDTLSTLNIMSGIEASMSVTSPTASAGFTASADGSIIPMSTGFNQQNSNHDFVGTIHPVCIDEYGQSNCLVEVGGRTIKLTQPSYGMPNSVSASFFFEGRHFSLFAAPGSYNVDATGIVNWNQVNPNPYPGGYYGPKGGGS